MSIVSLSRRASADALTPMRRFTTSTETSSTIGCPICECFPRASTPESITQRFGTFERKCAACGRNCGKPSLLDLFSGAGGAARGYQQAGFCVLGIDVKPQPHYIGCRFIQADALRPPVRLEDFDVIHASPPCQRYTRAQNAAQNAEAHPDLVAPVRALLAASGRSWVMENVVGAPLATVAILCGLAFGLGVKRHRLFESSELLMVPPCPSHDQDYYVIFGHEVRNRRHGQAAGRKNHIMEGRVAMGIDWMTRGELSEAIPPAYTEFIGCQLLEHLGVAA